MTHCCSQCDFTSRFESAYLMHHQLHHDNKNKFGDKCHNQLKCKSEARTRSISPESALSFKYDKAFKGPSRTLSATRLFDKLRARICRSRTLLPPPEDPGSPAFNEFSTHDTSLDVVSEGTSKGLMEESLPPRPTPMTSLPVPPSVKEPEIYSCHLCGFDADRITVLDRHLLNDHKIGLEDLLKLVMVKTRDGLTEPPVDLTCSIRRPYYRSTVKVMADEEFIIETVVPKVKIMKHASTNTDLKWEDIPNLKDNCQMITKELQNLIKLKENTPEKCDQQHFLEKMQTLNEYMCKFMDTSNTLKRTLTKEFGSRNSIRERLSVDQPFFDLTLERDSPQEWERTHSEKIERNRMRAEKKMVAESLYF